MKLPKKTIVKIYIVREVLKVLYKLLFCIIYKSKSLKAS